MSDSQSPQSQAVLVQVAQAVAAELNAHAFSLPFTAEAGYLTDMELQDSGVLHVDVVPVNGPMELATEASVKYIPRVDIGIRERIGQQNPAVPGEDLGDRGGIDQDRINRLMYLVQEIAEAFVPLELPAVENCVWQSTDIRAWYVPRHLREWHQFTGLIRLEFRVERDLQS